MNDEIRAAQAAVDEWRVKLFTISKRTLQDHIRGRIQIDFTHLPDDAYLDIGEFDPYRRAHIIYVYSSSYDRATEGSLLPEGGPLKLMPKR